VVESKLPLTEVYNNLGVVASRRHTSAVPYFQQAVQLDPNDADYRFNLGVALYKAGDIVGAARQLREALARRPNDSEARDFLNTITGVTPASASGTSLPAGQKSNAFKTPLERIKTNYNETSYRQLAMEVRNAMERTLANSDPKTHANFHVEHGMDLLNRGLLADAELEFREAILLDPTDPRSHAGLAQVAEANGFGDVARQEAQTSLRLGENADAYIVLGRLDLKDNNTNGAEQNADRALALDPANAAAAALKREVEAKKK